MVFFRYSTPVVVGPTPYTYDHPSDVSDDEPIYDVPPTKALNVPKGILIV